MCRINLYHTRRKDAQTSSDEEVRRRWRKRKRRASTSLVTEQQRQCPRRYWRGTGLWWYSFARTAAGGFD
jgi:hypothetical protein